MILKRLNKTQNLDPYKAHGNRKSSIRMIKIWVNQFVNLYSLSLIKLLSLVLFRYNGKRPI